MKGVLLMQKFNSKRDYIDALAGAFKVAEKMNISESETDESYFTYFTPAYTVTGKMFIGEPFEAQDFDSLYEELAERLEKGKINTLDIANTMAVFSKKKILSNKDVETYDDDKILILEDVEIRDINNTSYKTPVFILFVDQIIGIIPSKLE
jgi:hypothetical protein